MPEKRPNSVKLGVKSRPMGFETKTAVSVAEMARMVGLSRARFYQLLAFTTGSSPPITCLVDFTVNPGVAGAW
jgi:hypothetical protein